LNPVIADQLTRYLACGLETCNTKKADRILRRDVPVYPDLVGELRKFIAAGGDALEMRAYELDTLQALVTEHVEI
jgi:hypothetical protein